MKEINTQNKTKQNSKYSIILTILIGLWGLSLSSCPSGGSNNTSPTSIPCSDAGLVGTEGTDCAGMLVVSREMLIEDAVCVMDDCSITVDGTAYTFGDSDKNIYTGQVTNMTNLFQSKASFNADIGYWDVSKVTDMSFMFSNAAAFNQDLRRWNVSNVTDMSFMFNSAAAFNQDIGSWNVSNVTNMRNMFFGVTTFNQDIGSWNVSRVQNMRSMFWAAAAFNQDIGSWDVSNVTDMANMFRNGIFNQNIGCWDVSKVAGMTNMFNRAVAFNQDLRRWNVMTITAAPNNFDQTATVWTMSRPLWGMAPDDRSDCPN